MTLEAVVSLLVGSAPIFAQLLQVFSDDRARRRLAQDAAILQQLPNQSAAHRALLSHVEGQVKALVQGDDPEVRRQPGMAIAAGLTAAAVTWLAITLVQLSWLWLLLAVPLFLLVIVLIVGVGESMGRVRRDEKGRRLPSK